MPNNLFNEIKALSRHLRNFLALAFCILLATAIPYVNVFMLDNKVGEHSLTEFLQEVWIALIVVLLLRLASKRPEMKEAFVLLAFLFAAILVREMDFVFDRLFRGAWFCVVTVLFIACVVYVYKHIETTADSLSRFFRSFQSGYLICGLLIVLVVSRLLGSGFFWKEMLGEHYTRVVKNMVEEGAELVGYTFCLVSVVLFLICKKDEGERDA